MILVAVYDKKAESFVSIFSSKNEAVAVRDFSQGCQDIQSNLSKYPEDYALFKLADINQETGEVSPTTTTIEKDGEKITIKKPKELVQANLFQTTGEKK